MLFANHESLNVSRGLCDSIKLLAEQRLAYETKLEERARSSAARPWSPSGSAAKPAAATQMKNASSRGLSVAQQAADSGMSKEGRVTYMKLRGDQLLHMAEMARHDGGVPIADCEGLAAEALEAYLAAQQEVTSTVDSSNATTNGIISSYGSHHNNALMRLHLLQVELALKISSVLFHLLDRPVEAWEVGYPTYLAAAERPVRLGARGLAITQALRDHLACIDIKSVESYQFEGGNRGMKTDTYGDICSANPRHQDSGGETARHRPVQGEWGFLRLSAENDKGIGQCAGLGRTASDKLRALAQVKQARARLEAVTATDRVLLGTMGCADIVLSALKKIFSAYTTNHAKPAQTRADGSKHLRAQMRKATPQVERRKGSVLSWLGFEALCRDFKIIPTAEAACHTAKIKTTTTVADPASPPRLGLHSQHKHKSVRGDSPSHQSSPRTPPDWLGSKSSRRQDSPPSVLLSANTSSGLLSEVEAFIAFVSACTHGSVVASFPDGGSGSGGVVGPNVKRVPNRAFSGMGIADEGEGTSCAEEDAAYWRGMERLVLSEFPTQDASGGAPGLNFRQFVDALARCGLLGFPGKCVDAMETLDGRGSSTGGARKGQERLSVAERAQAIFTEQMKILDGQHVDARLRQLVQPPAAVSHQEGNALGRRNRADGDKKGGEDVTGDGGNETRRSHTARGAASPRGLQGGNRRRATTAAASRPPKSALARMQTTSMREKKQVA